MKKNKLLLVDFNNLLYRAVFANQFLSHQGKFTGGVYGFINMIAGIVNRYKINRIVICKDAKPYKRTIHYKKYKQNRGKSISDDDLKRLSVAKKQLNKFIKEFSIPYAMKVGYEADDFIGTFCIRAWRKYDCVFIMSNDSDFYQLLGWAPAGNIFLVKTGGLYGLHQFEEDYPDIKPGDWPRIIALKGSHNGVPGIKGVGEKTAIKIIKEGISNDRLFEKYKHFPDEIVLRQELATFPFPRARRLLLPPTKRINYDRVRLIESCDSYGINPKEEFQKAFKRLSK